MSDSERSPLVGLLSKLKVTAPLGVACSAQLLPLLGSAHSPLISSLSLRMGRVCCFYTPGPTASLGPPPNPHTFAINPFVTEPSTNCSNLSMPSVSFRDPD